MHKKTRFSFLELKNKFDTREQEVKLSDYTFNLSDDKMFPSGSAHANSHSNEIRGQEFVRNSETTGNVAFLPLMTDTTHYDKHELSGINVDITANVSNSTLESSTNTSNIYVTENIDIGVYFDSPKQVYEIHVEPVNEMSNEKTVLVTDTSEWISLDSDNNFDSIKLKSEHDFQNVVQLRYKETIRNTNYFLNGTQYLTRSDNHFDSRSDDHHSTRSNSHHSTRESYHWSHHHGNWGGRHVTTRGNSHHSTRSNSHFDSRSDDH
ncbi:hypothetical protein EB155_03985, partial [archaeon]|nr:hypothetical protein [archaeon]